MNAARAVNPAEYPSHPEHPDHQPQPPCAGCTNDQHPHAFDCSNHHQKEDIMTTQTATQTTSAATTEQEEAFRRTAEAHTYTPGGGCRCGLIALKSSREEHAEHVRQTAEIPTATSTTTTTRLRFPLHDAIAAASATLPHTSKDDSTPIITAIQVGRDRWVATDRFTVGVWAVSRPEEHDVHSLTEEEREGDGPTITVPRDAVEWIAKIVASKLRQGKNYSAVLDYELRISQDTTTTHGAWDHTTTGDVVLEIVHGGKVERSQAFESIVGNFPPVLRLVNDWKPASELTPISVDPAHLEKVTTFARRSEKHAPVTMELGLGPSPEKPGPMRITFGQLTALVQPNLILR